MSFTLPDLPYDHNALEPHIDSTTMEIHHKRHHNLYITNLKNAIENSYCNVWCLTSSNYLPYSGYKPFSEKLSEYNQKFMCNQFVLKGGSYATPRNHIRSTYRNFYYPSDRWQFSGLRLASDLK